MMNSIKVFAPMTVANLGCGFDVIGMTLDGTGDVLEVAIGEGTGISIENKSDVSLPADIEKNVITPAVRAFQAAYKKPILVNITVLSKILPGSGVGSSAASSAAAVFGLNELTGRPFSGKQLVEFAMDGEKLISGSRHADNVAPALLGGVVLIRENEPLDLVKLPVPDDFYCSVVHPHITVTTMEGRSVLPQQIPLRDAVTQWGNVGSLVAGLALNDMQLVGRSIKDVVVEPYRKRFIPEYDLLKKTLMNTGALAVNIAGSGPSVFAISENMAAAEKLAGVMKKHFFNLSIEADTYTSKVSSIGSRVLSNN